MAIAVRFPFSPSSASNSLIQAISFSFKFRHNALRIPNWYPRWRMFRNIQPIFRYLDLGSLASVHWPLAYSRRCVRSVCPYSGAMVPGGQVLKV